MWLRIADCLNESTMKFTMTKKTVPEHFNMILEKFNANGRNEARCSGVTVKDSKLDVLMKKGWIFLSSPWYIYCSRILLAESLKSARSCFLDAVSTFIGVGTNFNPRESRLI